MATPVVNQKVKSMIAKRSPPTGREMASTLRVSRGTMQHIIKNILEARLKKKCKVHQRNFKQMRRTRSWNLYWKLSGNKWKNFVTTYEAMFYMGGSYGRLICNLRKCEKVSDKHKFVKHDSFTRDFMASYRGKTEIRIIDKGTKVNSKYYCEQVLQPFFGQ